MSRDRAPPDDEKQRGASFRSIFEEQSSFVWNELRRFGVPFGQLEDLVHDVFVTVYRRLADYDRSRPLRPWLAGIAFRVAADHRRLARHRHEVPSGDGEEPADEGAPAEQQMEARQDCRLVMKALEGIPVDRRAVLVMHDIDGFTVPEIAAAVAIPLNTAYSRLRLARAELAAAIQRVRLNRGSR